MAPITSVDRLKAHAVFVTGAAGFIGSHLVDRLLSLNYEVVGYDNFSTGREGFLKEALKNSCFKLIRGDLLDRDLLLQSLSGCDFVFHFAANADVRRGLEHPGKDLEQNTIATFNLLEAMREQKIRRIAFPSTGSVYGEALIIPTPEDASFPIQTSLYGASKLACESLIQAYSEGFDFQSWIFRFVSILGERYTHGHVIDFYQKLLANPNELEVLGNGRQKKSYLYVQDCLDAMWTAIGKAKDKVNIFNLGTDEYSTVDNSIEWICQEMKLNPKIKYTGGDRGWIGDNPFIYLDCKKIRSLEWIPKVSIKESVLKTLRYLKTHAELIPAI